MLTVVLFMAHVQIGWIVSVIWTVCLWGLGWKEVVRRDCSMDEFVYHQGFPNDIHIGQLMQVWASTVKQTEEQVTF